MSQALDLLNSLSEEEIAQLAGLGSEEAHIVIGRDRVITVPPGLRRIAVQGDHNIETVTFDCPRFWDDNDLSQMAVYINYMLANGYKDRYPVDNIRADGDIMHFDWTVSKNVTPISGRVSFLVCAIDTEDTVDEYGEVIEAAEKHHWNSELNQDMYVSGGLECDENSIINDPDLVSQLLQRMNVVEQINIKAAEMEQILADAQTAQAASEEARDIATDASGYIKNEYANALKSKASGELIRVDDASPIEHDVRVRVRGKNLLDLSKAVGITSDNNPSVDGDSLVFPVNGKEAWGVKWSNVPLQVGQTYTFSVKGASKHDTTWGWRIKYTDGTYYDGTVSPAITITVDKPIELVSFYISWGVFTLDEQVTVEQLMIELGATATDYEPYIDPSTMTVTACGKNIFNIDDKTQTLNGVTYTTNDDGSITVNGTATKSTFFSLGKLYPVPGQRYHLSGGPSGSAFSTYMLYLHNGTTGTDVYDLGEGKAFTASAGDQGMIFVVYDGVTVTNLRVYPLVVAGENGEEYESYKGATFTPASDGTCAVTSVSPSMTIYSDTPGVTIEAEYNRDTNKALGSITQTELSLTDTTTGKLYKLYVSNGKLMLAESEV